jgi:hypothetical protein
VISSGSHELEWTFRWRRATCTAAKGGRAAEFEVGRLEVESEGLRFTVEEGWYSPSYGVREPMSLLRARRRGRPGTDVTEILLRLHD